MDPVLPAVLPEFQGLLFAVLRCAVANSQLASNLRKTDGERLRELRREGFTLHESNGTGNNCLIHSLAIVLSKAGIIRELPNSREACNGIRQYLIRTPGLHPLTPQGRRDATAYLEHGRHGAAVAQRLLDEFALPSRAVVNLDVKVHARYDTAQNPPDGFVVPTQAAVSSTMVHLWNWTGRGTSGFHYDGLHAQRISSI